MNIGPLPLRMVIASLPFAFALAIAHAAPMQDPPRNSLISRPLPPVSVCRCCIDDPSNSCCKDCQIQGILEHVLPVFAEIIFPARATRQDCDRIVRMSSQQQRGGTVRGAEEPEL